MQESTGLQCQMQHQHYVNNIGCIAKLLLKGVLTVGHNTCIFSWDHFWAYSSKACCYPHTQMSSYQIVSRYIMSVALTILQKREANRYNWAFFYPNSCKVNPRPTFSVPWTAPGFKNSFHIWLNIQELCLHNAFYKKKTCHSLETQQEPLSQL